MPTACLDHWLTLVVCTEMTGLSGYYGRSGRGIIIPWSFCTLKMPLEIHPAVQYPNDINPVRIPPEENHVRPDRVFPIPPPDVIARTSKAGRSHQALNRQIDVPDIPLSLSAAPAINRIIPDVLQVRLCPRRKTITGHALEVPAPRLRAMNASKSNASGSPLSSPSIKAARSAASYVSWSSSSRRPARTTSLALPYRP